MKNLHISLLIFLLSGCTQYKSIDNYKLKKLPGYEIPVCVNYLTIVKETPQWIDIRGTSRNKEENISSDNTSKQIVAYSYCLERLPKQIHLVEKREKDMTICYDRNNKVQLPILYCQKDINIHVNQSVTIN